MAIANHSSLPLAICIHSATPHEITLVESTLEASFIPEAPKFLIGDKAYDSDIHDRKVLCERGIQLIAPHRRKRARKATQDLRVLRRYRRRWNVERLFAWLQNFRRLVVRYERHADNFLGFVYLGCMLIFLRNYF